MSLKTTAAEIESSIDTNRSARVLSELLPHHPGQAYTHVLMRYSTRLKVLTELRQ